MAPEAGGGRAARERLHRRLTSQGLTGSPLEDPVAVVRRLLAIQAQDPRGARLAIRARTRGLSAADVDRALTHERSLVLTWLNRGTLHLVAAEDYPLLQALTTPPLRTASATRLRQEGFDAGAADRAVALVERALAEAGPLTGPQLRERLIAAGLPAAGPGLVHVLLRASLDGVLVRGPVVDGEHAYVRVADWLPELPARVAAVAADRERALSELARRYLAGHAPADAADLARWAGLPLRDARTGLAALGAALLERPDGLVELGCTISAARSPRLPPPRLLGAFEPLLMGWCSRADVLGEHERAVVTGGIFRGFALVDGRAAGVWRFAGPSVEFSPFAPLAEPVAAALQRDAVAVGAFLGRG